VAKKAVDVQALALESLAQALADAKSRVLLGSSAVPGFFKGSSPAVKAAARMCEDRGWVTAVDDWAGKGRSRKQKYQITPAGVQAVLENSESISLLRNLSTSLRQQVEIFAALRDQFGQLLDHRQQLAATVARLAEKIEPPRVAEILARLQQNARPAVPSEPPRALPAGPKVSDIADDVVRLLEEQRARDRYQPLTLPQIYAKLKQTRPALTIGQFHDGLRALRDQGRIRLSPFTRALATIDDPRNALFLDGEVMYYVELP